MESQRAWEQYRFWYSYHLNHVYFRRENGSHLLHWSNCNECTDALARTKYDDKTGRFGLRSWKAREIAKVKV